MKNLKFPLAVLVATKDVASNNPSFSVHDVTKKLRAMVNAGELSFTDRAQEDVDGINTFRVTHDDVKESFNEIWANDVVTLNRRSGGSGYFLYELSQPVTSSIQGLQSPPIFFDGKNPVPVVACGSKGLAVPATLTPAAISSKPLDTFALQVNAYINNVQNDGRSLTLKQIQSRFKGIYKTCTEYAAIVEALGFGLHKSDPKYPSTWEVA